MNVKTVYRLTGYLSLAVGTLAALSVYRMQYIRVGVALSILGFVLSVINIFLNSKYYFDQEKFPKGYLGMFLSSLPVIFILLLVFKFGKQA